MSSLHVTVTATHPPNWHTANNSILSMFGTLGDTDPNSTYEMSATIDGRLVTATGSRWADTLRRLLDDAGYALDTHPNRIDDITISMRRRFVEPSPRPTGKLERNTINTIQPPPVFRNIDLHHTADQSGDGIATPDDYLA